MDEYMNAITWGGNGWFGYLNSFNCLLLKSCDIRAVEGTVTLENFPYLNYEYELLLKLFMKELKHHYCNTTKQQYVSEFNSNISRSFGYAFGNATYRWVRQSFSLKMKHRWR